jgi:hypothetical protein
MEKAKAHMKCVAYMRVVARIERIECPRGCRGCVQEGNQAEKRAWELFNKLRETNKVNVIHYNVSAHSVHTYVYKPLSL